MYRQGILPVSEAFYRAGAAKGMVAVSFVAEDKVADSYTELVFAAFGTEIVVVIPDGTTGILHQ